MGNIKEIIKILISASVGVYIGKCLWIRFDYLLNPENYKPYSAPWYFLLIPYTVTILALILVEFIAYIAVCRMMKNKNGQV